MHKHNTEIHRFSYEIYANLAKEVMSLSENWKFKCISTYKLSYASQSNTELS